MDMVENLKQLKIFKQRNSTNRIVLIENMKLIAKVRERHFRTNTIRNGSIRIEFQSLTL